MQEEIVSLVQEVRKYTNYSLQQIANELNISKSQLSNLIAGRRKSDTIIHNLQLLVERYKNNPTTTNTTQNTTSLITQMKTDMQQAYQEKRQYEQLVEWAYKYLGKHRYNYNTFNSELNKMLDEITVKQAIQAYQNFKLSQERIRIAALEAQYAYQHKLLETAQKQTYKISSPNIAGYLQAPKNQQDTQNEDEQQRQQNAINMFRELEEIRKRYH